MIRSKAFVMLVAFAASFVVFCRCEPVAAAAASSCCQRSCCEQKKKTDHGCQGMAAVKLNLQEKQIVAAFHVAALPMVLVERGIGERVPSVRETAGFAAFWSYKHSPPDRLTFYQCFLI